MVIFDVRPTEGHFVVTDMQKVTSAYTKTTGAVGFVKNSFVMYADKKRATPLLRTIGFHTPIELRQGGYVGSIAYNKQNVNLYGEEFSNVFREGTTKYSRELDSEYMELAKDPEGNSTELRKMVDQAAEQQEVDSILNMQDTTTRQLIVGYTPTVYRQLGMPSLPLTIGSGHVYSAAKTEAEAKQDGNFRKGTNYHGLGDTALKNIYKAIQNPVMVIAAKDVNKNVSPLRSTHSVVAIVDIGTAKKSLLVPIEITAERTVNGTQMDVNTISSVYERNVGNLVKEAIALENSGDVGVYYAKKEAMTLPVAGVRFPAQLQQSIASNGIIHRFSEKVNMNISEMVCDATGEMNAFATEETSTVAGEVGLFLRDLRSSLCWTIFRKAPQFTYKMKMSLRQ